MTFILWYITGIMSHIFIQYYFDRIDNGISLKSFLSFLSVPSNILILLFIGITGPIVLLVFIIVILFDSSITVKIKDFMNTPLYKIQE